MASTEVARRAETTVAKGAEQTHTRPVFAPAVDIYETDEALVILADMPGVSKDSLTVRLEDDVLTLEGEAPEVVGEGETVLLQEYRTGRFWRQFAISEAIDREKIEATLTNGELKLVLPKAEAAKPHKIEVKAG